MEYTILQAKNFKTTRWSGGTTTELFIFPTESEYQKRNFDFRISTAKVEAENSEFTLLPGISRKIMVLDGEIGISHENHYSKTLKKFDVDEFKGDWKTTSTGKCTDFNLMTRNETKGEFKALFFEKNQTGHYTTKVGLDWLFIYVHSGKVNLELNGKNETLNKNDLLVVKKPGQKNIMIHGLINSELILLQFL